MVHHSHNKHTHTQDVDSAFESSWSLCVCVSESLHLAARNSLLGNQCSSPSGAGSCLLHNRGTVLFPAPWRLCVCVCVGVCGGVCVCVCVCA